MIPSSDVVTLAIAVVLQADGIHEVCVLQCWVQCFDFVVECHHAALTIDAENLDVAVELEKLKVGDVAVTKPYSST